jgi:predicted permease
MPLTEWRFVSADYFATMGLAVQRGRVFAPDDGRATTETTEVLVNDAFVRAFLADVDPIGKQVNVMDDVPKTIVGVVESARQWGLAREPSPEVYLPIYDVFYSNIQVVARTRGDPAQAAEPLRRAIREVLPEAPVTSVRTMAEIVRDGAMMRRFFATLMIAFSAVALVLAMVGLYGVIAYSVAQRRAEIGVRMSLGADRSRVLAMVLKQGLALVALGLGIGVFGALALARVIASQLYGVSPYDPLVLGAVAVALLATGAAACALPAWRAARIPPIEALRHE